MKIRFTPEIALQLETCTVQVGSQEFSGLGFVRTDKETQEFVVYKFFPLNVGSYTFTQIDPKKILPILQEPDADNLRCWIHRHTVGNGVPGPQNWSGTDNETIRVEPLGGNPQLVQWSISCVRTPYGWVGRVDNHLTGKTQHLEVVGQCPKDVYDTINAIVGEYRSAVDTRQVAYFADDKYIQDELDLEPDEALVEEYSSRLDDVIENFQFMEAGDDIEERIDEADMLIDEIEGVFGNTPAALENKISELNSLIEDREYA